jgi:hypothetical protein
MGASCFAAGSCMVVGVNESGSGPMWVSTQNYGRSWLSVVLSRGSGIVDSAESKMPTPRASTDAHLK